jgi:hypothetical protein
MAAANKKRRIMAQWIIGFIAAALTWSSVFPAIAETPPALVVNGCGSGAIGFLVPDTALFNHCQFKESCNTHDRCYARCLSGGDLFKNPICTDSDGRKYRRQICDTALQTNIVASNSNKAACGLWASVYRVAVQLIGENFFDGAGGPPPPGAEQLNGLLAYLDQNPESFDLAELEREFVKAADLGLTGTDYSFWLFDGEKPLLVALHGNKEIFKIEGRRKTP